MFKLVAISAVAAFSLTAFIRNTTSFVVAEIDQATAIQCANHNWSVEAHDIHVEWCEANGYATK